MVSLQLQHCQSLLLPVLRAYGFAYVSTTGPRFLTLLVAVFRGRLSRQRALLSIYSIFVSALDHRRFPMFCGALVAGYKLLQVPARSILFMLVYGKASRNGSRTNLGARFVAAFLSAWFSLQLLNSPRQKSGLREQAIRVQSSEVELATNEVARPSITSQKSTSTLSSGRTVDLTLFAATRAIETIVVGLWRRQASQCDLAASVSRIISNNADAVIFAISSGTVMWSWIYRPEKLPLAYNKWIGEAAQIDSRLIEALRKARQGDFVYGEDKGEQALILQSMCKDYGWPLQWGDGQKTIPIPCEMVHMNAGSSCHWHAAIRFLRAFRFAMATNLPLQFLVKVLAKKQISTEAFYRAFREALQSSAFLGAFVALMYYGICLSRTQIGPLLFDSSTVTPQMWDSGLCIRTACMLCGWSILLEAPRKRQELGMFVAPRALATLFPRAYDAQYFWREQAAFSLSIAVLFPLAQQDSKAVRGVLGRLLGRILRQP